MARGFMTFDQGTGELRYVPPWPPRPHKGDLWVKDGRRKPLSRQILSVEGGKVIYLNEDGSPKSCHIDSFISWCVGARIARHKGKKVVYT